jgi:hypothetical protein
MLLPLTSLASNAITFRRMFGLCRNVDGAARTSARHSPDIFNAWHHPWSPGLFNAFGDGLKWFG